MEWWGILFVFIALLFIVLGSGMPVAFAFMTLNLFGIYVWGGGSEALGVVLYSAFTALTSFTMVAGPLFILMGEILSRSGMMRLIIEGIDKWIGRIPGRLALCAVAAGTIFGALSGSGIAGIATIGGTLIPEMKRMGYKEQLSIGPVIGSAGLALIIPPSMFAVVVAAVAEVSLGRLVIACIVPGLMLAGMYAIYIMIRAKIQPHLAPPPTMRGVSLREKAHALTYILPIGLIIFLVTGIIFIGIATPTEAAALGALAAFVITALWKRLTSAAVRETMLAATRVTGMIFMIVAGSTAFSEFLAFTGSTGGLSAFAVSLRVPPLVILILTQLVILILGFMIDEYSIIMVTMPIFMPIITSLGYDPIWFCVIVIIGLIVGCSTPPFGLFLFVVKGMMPEYSMAGIIKSSVPFFLIAILEMAILIAFPQIALWLPRIMK